MLVDTHAHIHFPDFGLPLEDVFINAQAAGVERIICVGTTVADSQLAVAFAAEHSQCAASIGLHPHDAKDGSVAFKQLEDLVTQPQVVAIGECGLDYYYNHSDKADQEAALRWQIELAQAHNKPLIFHVREAFADFFRIFDEYKSASRRMRGVVHSFSATEDELAQVLERGLSVGLNGIMTFTKNADQLAAARQVPLERLLLETDCPFLTPTPKRGTINEPANVKIIAEFLANLRGESFEQIAQASTNNATALFNL